MQREQRQTAPQAHYEGLSSDDEETNSQEVFYQETLGLCPFLLGTT